MRNATAQWLLGWWNGAVDAEELGREILSDLAAPRAGAGWSLGEGS